MKVSELTINHYCDFCSLEKRTRTSTRCILCGKDVCGRHAYPVGMPRKNGGAGIPGINPIADPNGVDAFKSSSNLFQFYEFYPVCPDCAGRPLLGIALRITGGGFSPSSSTTTRDGEWTNS